MESDFSFLRGQSYFSSTVNWTIFLCFFFVNNFRKCRTRRCVRFYHLATIRLMCTLYSVYNVMVALLPWSQYKIRAHNRWTRTETTTTTKKTFKNIVLKFLQKHVLWSRFVGFTFSFFFLYCCLLLFMYMWPVSAMFWFRWKFSVPENVQW